MAVELVQGVTENNINNVKSLLEQGQDPNQTIEDGSSLLILACGAGNLEMALLLLQHGANVHFVSARNITALRLACYVDNIDLVKILLDHGADANEKVKIRIEDPQDKKMIEAEIASGTHALIEIAHPSLVESLHHVNEEQKIQNAIMINRYPDRYLTPLHNAVEAKNAQMVELLLSHGAEVDLRDNYTHTALHNAAWLGLIDIVKVLIKYGAEINARTQFGETPLYLVCSEGSDLSNKEGRILVAKYLLEHGANLLETDKVYAEGLLEELYDQEYKSDDIEIIKLLIQHGAKASESAIEYFSKHGYKDILDLIKQRS